MNKTGGKLQCQTKQRLNCLVFYITTEKQETFKVELDFTATQAKTTELFVGPSTHTSQPLYILSPLPRRDTTF